VKQVSIKAGDTVMEDSSKLCSDDFARIVARIRDLTGIVIQDHRTEMVRARISERVSRLGFKNFPSYLDFLDGPEGHSEQESFCNALTTNLTSFFREHHHFDHFSHELSRLVGANAKKARIWSAGCSTGEEAYSIALLLLRAGVRAAIPDTKVLATDIDSNVLKIAKRSSYRLSKLSELSVCNGRKLVNIEGEEFRFNEDVRDLIAFKSLNLQDSWPMRGKFDVIFCRNVLIYFSAETKANLICRFEKMLKPNGVLYLGHSENLLGDHPKLTNEGPTTYRKLSG